MKFRVVLSTVLSLSCLTFVGCGGSNAPVTSAELKNEPLNPADKAAVEAELQRVQSDESAVQSAGEPEKPEKSAKATGKKAR